MDAPGPCLNTSGVPERPTFLDEPPASEATAQAYEADLESDGCVENLTRLWSWRPELYDSFVGQRTQLMASSALTDRDWAVLVTATAEQRGDSYWALAWGPRLAKLSDDETAAQVIAGTVNDALRAAPDQQLADAAPTPVRAGVSWGRQPSAKPSSP